MISGYGLENLILERANLSKSLPLIPNYDHGWMLVDKIPKGFSNNPSKVHLSWNLRSKIWYSQNIKKKNYIIGAPFLFFKEKFNVKKKNKKNTLFFFSHSTSKMNLELNLEKLLYDLTQLPSGLKPIDICLHFNDLKIYKNIFEKNGFQTLSAGNIYCENFVENFYNIISNYSKIASNTLGTYTLYSINLDIPFFLVGDEPIYNNFGNDINVPFKKYRVSDSFFAKKIFPLFDRILDKPTDEQKKLASEELGEFTRIDREELNKIIRETYYEIFLSLKNMNSFARSLIRPIIAKYKLFFS